VVIAFLLGGLVAAGVVYAPVGPADLPDVSVQQDSPDTSHRTPTEADADPAAAAAKQSTTTATPTPKDSDGDGLIDAAERQQYSTDPGDPDTDGDGLDDGREVDLNTDPRSADTDDDGLDDERELDLGTKPTSADSDQDDLDDGREIEESTDPTEADTDGDGLRDGREIELQTDPTARDTDLDSIADGTEVEMEAADPRSRDLFIEIDRVETGTHWSPESYMDKVRSTFEDAPIENPDGTFGIDVHVQRENVVPDAQGPFDRETFEAYKSRYQDHSEVYYYVLWVDDLGVEDYRGVYYTDLNGIMVDQEAGFFSGEAEAVLVHELGHNMGLLDCVFDGVDSREYAFEEYRSVMNYNRPGDYYGFSRGPPFNDWEFLAQKPLDEIPC
jgi:hypothetical protein